MFKLTRTDAANWRQALEVEVRPDQLPFVADHQPVALIILSKCYPGRTAAPGRRTSPSRTTTPWAWPPSCPTQTAPSSATSWYGRGPFGPVGGLPGRGCSDREAKGTTMTAANTAWNDVGDRLSALCLKLKLHAKEELSEEDLAGKAGFDKLRAVLDETIDAIEDAYEDEAVRADARDAGRAFVDALDATLKDATSRMRASAS